MESPAGYVRLEPPKEGTDQELINRKGRDFYLATTESNLAIDRRHDIPQKAVPRPPVALTCQGLERTSPELGSSSAPLSPVNRWAS